MIRIVIALLLASMAFAAQETPSNRKEGAITGQVLGEDGQPVARASIESNSLGAKSRYNRPVSTDREGNFKLTQLPPGLYAVNAFLPGFVADNGQQPRYYRVGDHVTIRMVKGGVISGRVLDIRGEPLVNIRVFPRKIREEAGTRTILDTDAFRYFPMTDDRGYYRIFGLPAGTYLVYATIQNAPFTYYPALRGPTYHPSSTREGATEITLQAGQEVSGVDIRERTETGIRVSGRVIADADAFQGRESVAVNLVNRIDGRSEGTAFAQRSGEFEMNGVFDGDYEIFASQYSREQNLLASPAQRISIRGADLTGLNLPMKRLGSIEGRVVIETSTPSRKCNPAVTFNREEIMLRATAMQPAREYLQVLGAFPLWMRTGNTVDDKGAFALRTLPPGTYFPIADLPDESWYVKSIERGKNAPPISAGIPLKLGETISDVSLTIAEGGTSLAGRVESKKKMRVYLFPAAASNDLLRHAEMTTNADGGFQFNHLAPGKYLLLAKPAPAADPEIPQLWNAADRAALRREAEAAKKEVELLSCKPVKSYALTP